MLSSEFQQENRVTNITERIGRRAMFEFIYPSETPEQLMWMAGKEILDTMYNSYWIDHQYGIITIPPPAPGKERPDHRVLIRGVIFKERDLTQEKLTEEQKYGFELKRKYLYKVWADPQIVRVSMDATGKILQFKHVNPETAHRAQEFIA